MTVTLTSGTGTLGGTTARTTDATGSATFNDLSIDQLGSKRLTASAAGFGSVQSVFFTVIQPPSTLLSDDFNAFEINASVWTFINPLGDGTLAVSGTNTPDAAAILTIPGGIAHDAEAGGLRVPRIMQATNNTDFEVEAKFLSPVTTRFQMQGIVVEQDSLNFVRIDVNSDGFNTRVFVNRVTGGVPTPMASYSIGLNGVLPLYVRMRREGNNWSPFYSLNGVSWNPTGTFTHSLTVTRVGPLWQTPEHRCRRTWPRSTTSSIRPPRLSPKTGASPLIQSPPWS